MFSFQRLRKEERNYVSINFINFNQTKAGFKPSLLFPRE